MKRVSFVLTIALALAAAPTVIAQQAQGGAPGKTVHVVETAPTSMTNVRLDLTVTDQSGGGQPIKKAISLLVAERGDGRVRSIGMAVPQGGPSYSVSLNADAAIGRIEGNLIRIHVTVEYSPAAPETGIANRGSQLSQTVEVVLTNGKPTVIVQAADPLTDRKVTLEATATIVR
ncbi:MAG TPA: hypothetical protein VMN81_14375 [Vicinamibacterales bacterium]|nr:hypothetical protein [Vicinamibacterales bacterium]